MAQQPSNNPHSNGAGIYSNAAAVNGSIMPSAGHYADMQTLMQSMETLSGWLQQNREEWTGLQEGLARVERVQARVLQHNESANGGVLGPDGPGISNGEAYATHERPSAPENDDSPTLTSLQSALSAAHTRISHLETHLRTQETLQTLYESTLTDATSQIRHYCFEQQNYIISLHRHYTQLLQQSREELVEAQLVHQAWQEGLGRLSGMVREAYRGREEERRPWMGRIRGLRDENRRLRKMVGWALVRDDSEEEEEESPERGRGSRGNLGVGEEGGGSGEGGGVV